MSHPCHNSDLKTKVINRRSVYARNSSTNIVKIIILMSDDSTGPDSSINPSFPLVCLEYSPKDPNVLAGGMYNGRLGFWDTRRGAEPFDQSTMWLSHKDPAFSVVWLASKTGTELMSASTDAQVLVNVFHHPLPSVSILCR